MVPALTLHFLSTGGLAPNYSLSLPVTVTAEDGVTSNTYPLLVGPPLAAPALPVLPPNGSASWPLAPADQQQCQV